jgi:hypothetical protein
MEGAWGECFESFRAFLEYCIPQECALSAVGNDGDIRIQEISLDVAYDTICPVEGTVVLEYDKLLPKGRPICFIVPRVGFVFKGVRYVSTRKIVAGDA